MTMAIFGWVVFIFGGAVFVGKFCAGMALTFIQGDFGNVQICVGDVT